MGAFWSGASKVEDPTFTGGQFPRILACWFPVLCYYWANQAENPIKQRISAQSAGTARAALKRVFETGRFFMPERTEINIPHLHELYHDKRVLVRIGRPDNPRVLLGKFFVGANSKWMRIDFTVGFERGLPLERSFEIDQEIAESIQPASATLKDDSGGRIDFSIPIILPSPLHE